MFNIGAGELLVLALVGLLVLGPERLPGIARDAARMIRTLRELANGARTQLKEELGPEFADVDLSSLNPRTAIQRALFEPDPEPVKPVSGAPTNGTQPAAQPSGPPKIDEETT